MVQGPRREHTEPFAARLTFACPKTLTVRKPKLSLKLRTFLTPRPLLLSCKWHAERSVVGNLRVQFPSTRPVILGVNSAQADNLSVHFRG